jgi:hypothetical protein
MYSGDYVVLDLDFSNALFVYSVFSVVSKENYPDMIFIETSRGCQTLKYECGDR